VLSTTSRVGRAEWVVARQARVVARQARVVARQARVVARQARVVARQARVVARQGVADGDALSEGLGSAAAGDRLAYGPSGARTGTIHEAVPPESTLALIWT